MIMRIEPTPASYSLLPPTAGAGVGATLVHDAIMVPADGKLMYS